MEKTEQKIQALLKSQTTVNNSLAFQLIQSQWGWSIEKTLQYIFEFQVKSFWTKKTTSYSFEVDCYKFECRFEEDDDIHIYSLDLICKIETPTQKVSEKKYLGTFDYDFGFGSNGPSCLLDEKATIQQLFDQVLEKLLEA